MVVALGFVAGCGGAPAPAPTPAAPVTDNGHETGTTDDSAHAHEEF